MEDFKSKEEVFEYVLDKYGKKARSALVRGSTVNERVKPFSDFDFEIYSKKNKPVYEIQLCRGYPVLISIYFYDYKFGSLLLKPKNVLMLKGSYTSGLEEVFDKEINTKEPYRGEEVQVRQMQLMMDFFFKFIRTKDERFLDKVNKKMDFSSIVKRDKDGEKEQSDVEFEPTE